LNPKNYLQSLHPRFLFIRIWSCKYDIFRVTIAK
jgi:hypothetical protein